MELKDMTKAQLLEHIEKLEAEKAAGAPAATDEVVAGLNTRIGELEASLETTSQELTIAQAALKDAEDTETELQTIIRDLNSRSVIEQKIGTSGSNTVTHEGHTVTVLRAVTLWGDKYDVERIVNSPKALAHLIKIKSGAILIHT